MHPTTIRSLGAGWPARPRAEAGTIEGKTPAEMAKADVFLRNSRLEEVLVFIFESVGFILWRS